MAAQPGRGRPVTAERRHFILATAGHVDHGKSALVRELTGVDPDRLPEEKSRGISIELGFAELRLPSPRGESVVGIVDVPGHEDFVKMMAAGVAAADAALLVVAADDGPMPQTFEHLEILEYLGITRGIVAITKCDRVYDVEAVCAKVRERLKETVLADASMVAVSIHRPATMVGLKQSLSELLSALPLPKDVGKPRCWIDRAFIGKGVGTIVTGTLVGGELRRGQTVHLRPLGQQAQIRSLHTHHQAVECAFPGSRVAMNLPELTLNAEQPFAVCRGQIIVTADYTQVCNTFDVRLNRSNLCSRPTPRDGAEVRLLLGSASVVARLYRYSDASLARVKAFSPLPVLVGDRLIFRNASDQATLAGGVVLDIAPPDTRRWRNDPKQLRLLHSRDGNLGDLTTLLLSELERDGFVLSAAVDHRFNFATADMQHQIASLEKSLKLERIGAYLTSKSVLQMLSRMLQTAVADFHLRHPQRTGLPISEARGVLFAQMARGSASALIDATLDRLITASDLERAGHLLRSRSFKPTLPPRLQKAGDRLRNLLAHGGVSPPSRRELAPTDIDQEALRFLIANGEAIDLSAEIVLATLAFDQATSTVRQFLVDHGSATVTQLKSALNSSRRIVVPLLERLDRTGITSRRGDLRFLPQP